MRINEVIIKPAPTIEQVIEAMGAWFEMWQASKQVPIILASPAAAKFKHVEGNTLFRCVVLTKTGNFKAPKTTSLIATYTTDINAAHKFYNSLYIDNPYVIVQKKLNPADVALNFTAFANSLGQSGGWDEKEIWMKATPYYKDINPEEIVFDSRSDHS